MVILYIRFEYGMPTDLFYPDEKVSDDYADFHARKLLNLRFDKVEVWFGSYTDTARHGDVSTLGDNTITFKEVEEADLIILFEKWSDTNKPSIQDWTKEVLDEDLLDETEKLMIKSALANF